MSKKETKNTHADHPLVTRRDFLSQGVIGFSAYTIAPSILGMILNENAARAATCPVSGATNGAIPFLVFDCAGGASLSGNWVPTDAGGSILASGKYNTLGLGNAVPQTTTIFGAPMAGDPAQATQVSKILEGILATTTPQARACLRMGGMPHQSQSDTSANQSSIIGYVAAVGSQGTLIRSPLGTQTSVSGANSEVPYFDATLKPLAVRSINTLLGTINYQGALSNLPATSVKALAKSALNLSKDQAVSLSKMSLGQEFATLVECGLSKNQQLAAGGAVDSATGRLVQNSLVDPRLDATMQKIYGLTTTSSVTDANSIAASIVFNCVKGYTGPGAIQIGGCDYHTGTEDPTAGDRKDLEIGRHIGRAVQAAYELGKKLSFQIVTDGGNYSDPGVRIWRADSNSFGFSVFGYMDPAGAARMVRTQIGAVKANAAAETATFTGNNPARMAAITFANYLNVIGQLGQLTRFVPSSQLPPDLNSYLLFG